MTHERDAQVKYLDVELAGEGEFRRKDAQTTCPECDRQIGFGKGWHAADAGRGSVMSNTEIRKTARRRGGVSAMDFGSPHIILLCPVEACSKLDSGKVRCEPRAAIRMALGARFFRSMR